jgi:hypothetical protein
MRKAVDPGNNFSHNACIFIFHDQLKNRTKNATCGQIWRIPMAKGQKKSNRETKKPKKDKAVATVQTSIVPASGRLVPPKTSGRVSG